MPTHGLQPLNPLCPHIAAAIAERRPKQVFICVQDETDTIYALCEDCMRRKETEIKDVEDQVLALCYECVLEWTEATNNDLFARWLRIRRGESGPDELLP